MRADAAMRPNTRFDVDEGGGFVLEAFFGQDGRHDG
jgi:hypothetical protein